MDEQPRLDKRMRSESEDHQALAAAPSVVKVYRTSCHGVKTLMSKTTISFYTPSVVSVTFLTHNAQDSTTPNAPTHHVRFPEARSSTRMVSM